MSRFHSALDLVLGALDQRREAGYDDWRASAGAVDRLLSARPARSVAVAPAALPSPLDADDATPAVVAAADIALNRAVPEPLPSAPDEALSDMRAKDDSDASRSLFSDDDDGEPATAARPRGAGSGKKASAPASSKPGTYDPVTDPSQPKAQRLAALRACPDRIPCDECPYGKTAHSHVVFGVGNIDTEVMFIGEAPGADEDKQGEPFVGRAGQLLNKIISTMGFERSQIYLANVLKCRPDTPGQAFGNRPPTVPEMVSCRPCLFEQIDIIQPKVIVALGATAMRGLLDLTEPMGKLRGQWHDFNGIPVMASYHPSYLLRNQSPAEKRKVWEDLLLVKERLGHQITEKDRSYFLTKG